MGRVSATYTPGWGRGRVQAGLEAILRAATRPSTAGPRLHARGRVIGRPGPEVHAVVVAQGAAEGKDYRR